ncbi:MAG TPA: wax ester/triacylglycerol synthase family O-acyltransferase [Solirubrobacteraceae bacterium]|jgi:WS/DGAT/MGAT family acyltransferase|nr:wax ester/triacylglycerol synthase family O-acyltransferase [Solirubrobacteraceae bacterium]
MTETEIPPPIVTSAPRSGSLDAPLEWGSASEMNALEALMWRAEGDPRLRSTISALYQLDCLPDWDRFLAAHDWATRVVPRFRQRVVEPLLGLGLPCWAVDADFDLHYHVRRARLPEPGGWRELLSACEQIAMTPFDRARSPWEAYLFEGLPDGRSGYLLKMHHSTMDGMGAMQLFGQLHSRQREHSANKPQPPAPPPDEVSSADILRRQLARDARLGAGHLRSTAARGLRALARPDASVRDAVRFGGSLRRVLADPDAEGSPLLRGRSMSWRFSALDVAFADLRGASKAADATLNDAFLAAVLGGFRRYHEELGVTIDAIPMAVPISVRRESDAEGGNRFAGARIAGPAGIVDPVERMAAVGNLVRSARDEPAVDGLALVAPALARMPAALISQLAGNITKANDLQASNIPGIRHEVYIAGGKIERFYGFGPLPGCAVMMALISHGDTCCVSVNSDPAAVTDGERFDRCLREGFEEVLALVPDASAPVLRV